MAKKITRILGCIVLASTLVLTQGFLAGIPLGSNDGVAVALTAAEKRERIIRRAARKAARAAEKAGEMAEEAARAAKGAAQAAREAAEAAREAAEATEKEATEATEEEAAHDQP
mgnify:CR=1 FL=1